MRKVFPVPPGAAKKRIAPFPISILCMMVSKTNHCSASSVNISQTWFWMLSMLLAYDISLRTSEFTPAGICGTGRPNELESLPRIDSPNFECPAMPSFI